MPLPGKTLSSVERGSEESHSNHSEPLPLFRPEAIAALQQKFYGEIILVRPFSLMLLCWFALGITAAVLGFLFLGQYTERARVPGIISSSSLSNPGPTGAEFYVPASLRDRLHVGTHLTLRCNSCSTKFARQVGTVLEVPQTPVEPAELSQKNPGLSVPGDKIPVYKIKVSLPPQAAQDMQVDPSTQAGVRVEAEIPLGHKPLIKWFFERSGS
ncbi:MAG: hypothetical protein LAO76_02500 [Acidobacteriia bacterium]|nr:hypothetical protein [Terriglobia bacterium]